MATVKKAGYTYYFEGDLNSDFKRNFKSPVKLLKIVAAICLQIWDIVQRREHLALVISASEPPPQRNLRFHELIPHMSTFLS